MICSVLLRLWLIFINKNSLLVLVLSLVWVFTAIITTLGTFILINLLLPEEIDLIDIEEGITASARDILS